MRFRSLRRFATGALGAAALLAGCNNAGEDRVLGITATGVVTGFVFFDSDGDRAPQSLQFDVRLRGVRVRLVARGTQDTVARVTSDTGGIVRAANLPVGSYRVVVDTTSIGDSVQVVRIDTADVTVGPNDSVAIEVVVSFPSLSIDSARALPLGEKVFVNGVVLTPRSAPAGVFGDTTISLADSTRAIRATRVKGSSVIICNPLGGCDSLRLLGTTAARNGQPTLDDVTTFLLGTGRFPPLKQTTTALAATADGGRLDAALVRLLGDSIVDTLRVGPDFQARVVDSLGVDSLYIILDADAGFTGFSTCSSAPNPPCTPGRRIDITGLLVPTGTGRWQLKPRSAADVVTR